MTESDYTPRPVDDLDDPLPETPIGDVAREMTERIRTAPPLDDKFEQRTPPSSWAEGPTETATGAIAERPTTPTPPVASASVVTTATTKLEVRVTSIVDVVRAFVVKTAADYAALVSHLKTVKLLRKEVGETFDPIIEKQLAALNEARAQRKRHADPLDGAEVFGKRMLEDFDAEQQRLADEEQKRVEAEELARAHEQRLADAADADDAGDSVLAETILQTPVVTAPVTVTKSTPKIDGVAHKDNWKGDCPDLAKLVLAAADELKSTDRTKPRIAFSMLEAAAVKKAIDAQVNSRAKTMKSELNKVPGCRAWNARATSITV